MASDAVSVVSFSLGLYAVTVAVLATLRAATSAAVVV
jgi:hypothetical protein